MRFVGAVDIGMREGESVFIHIVGHSSCGWGEWRCRLGAAATVTATATAIGDVTGTMLMGPTGRSLVMNLGQV